MDNTTDNPPEKNLVKEILAWKKKREAVRNMRREV